MLVNAIHEYNTKIRSHTSLFDHSGGAMRERSGKACGGLMKSDAWFQIESGNYFEEQAKTDVAMWYGAMVSPGGSGLADLIKRVFYLMNYGGMQVKLHNKMWRQWSFLDWPLGVALSHGGRVMIQLHADSGPKVWKWLWGDMKPRPRGAATHGIVNSSDPNEKLWGGKVRHITEIGGKLAGLGIGHNGNHFGVEIALGGAGNRNPYSNRLIAPDGASGHLYFYYLPPDSVGSASRYHGILIGCEGSAPPDRREAKHSDHYGGGHSIFGGSNTFSGTGGIKFGGAKLKNPYTKKKVKVEWQNSIATGKGNLFIDLSNSRDVFDMVNERHPAFRPEWVASFGENPAQTCDLDDVDIDPAGRRLARPPLPLSGQAGNVAGVNPRAGGLGMGPRPLVPGR